MKKLFILMLLVALPLSAANVELNPTNHPDPTVDMCEFLGWNATDAKGVSFVGANLCYDASDTAAFFSDHGDCDNAGEVLQFDLATHVYSCGTLADADIPNTITIDLATLATTATTANAGDSATAFFSAGTIEHEYGGLEANLSAYNGLVDISGGTSSEVANLAELNTALGGAGIVTGAHFTPTAGVSTDHGAKAVALADLADGTDGELITWSAAGVAEAVAVGTATHVLTSNGVGLAPTFQAGAETNDLEATATSAGDAEIFVGTGVDTGAYITGLAACAADEKPEYVPGSPDTFTCEAIGGLVDADIEDTLTCSLYLPLAGGTMGGGLNMSTNDITMVSGQGIQAGGGFVWKIYDSTTPVNNLYINNADTGNAPAIGAEGSDAAVDLNLYSQGAGTIELKDATNVTGNLGVSGTVDGKDIGACLLNLAGLNTCVSSGLVTGAHTVETNDLSAAVTWANIPDANVPATHSGSAHHSVFSPNADPGVNHSGLSGDNFITEVAGALDLDAEVTKHVIPLYIELPVSAEQLESFWRAPVAVTVTEIWGETDAGTVGFDINIDDGTPLGINGSDISAAVSTGTADSTFANSASVAAGDRLDLDVGTVTTAVRLSIMITYTVDDV